MPMATAATVHHMAEDVAAFLMWAAEPKLMARKQAGFVSVIFLARAVDAAVS